VEACVAMLGQPDASPMLGGGRLLVVELVIEQGNEELLVVEVEEDTQLCSVRVIVETGSVMSSVLVMCEVTAGSVIFSVM
jgi:hypothetical protein